MHEVIEEIMNVRLIRRRQIDMSMSGALSEPYRVNICMCKIFPFAMAID